MATWIAALTLPQVQAQQTDREIRTRNRDNFDVLVGDYYTGRSPYTRSSGAAPAPAPVPAPAPAPAKPMPAPSPTCSVINTGLIHMSKTMPAEATLGSSFTSEIKVMATACAANVVVTDIVPDGASVVSTEPTATVNGKNVVWNLGNLDSGESKVLKITLKADKEGTLRACLKMGAEI